MRRRRPSRRWSRARARAPDEADIAFGLDPLGLSLRSGRAARAWDAEAAALAEAVGGLKGQGFRGPFVAADGRAVHAAGGTPAQELAFALGAAVSYWRALEDGGLSPEDARAAISFRLAADADQFVTLAKFRALRLLWARIGEAAGLAPRAARVHAESAWRMMSARDPFVNVMRGALAAFSAGLGGADSVALLPFSRAIGLPDAFARRLARNTQLIELRESHLGFVADPAAGAGAFEALTQGLCEKAWGVFQAFEAGRRLARSPCARASSRNRSPKRAKTLARDVARLKAPITGVSAHPDLGRSRGSRSLPAIAPKVEFRRRGLRARAGAAAPRRAVRASARRGRGARASRRACSSPRSARRRSMRAASAFARELFEAGGIAAIADSGAADARKIRSTRFLASGAELACLCGSDEGYRGHARGFRAAR